MAARYLFLDEVDAYEGDVDGEGNPVELAIARTTTFARRKILMVSTPKIKGLSRFLLDRDNRPDRSLVTKPTNGGRANWQAVTRVKLEQASKVKLWMPTRLRYGEGRADRESTDRSTGSVHRGSEHGMSGKWSG